MGRFVKGQAKPPGSGRKRGQLSRATLEYKAALASVGPFEGDSVAFMTMIYKHKDLPLGVRMQAASSVLNFERPRLSQIEMTTRSLDRMSDEDFFRAWDSVATSTLC